MIDTNDFDAIRPYRDHEVQQAIQELLESKYLNEALHFFFPNQNKEEITSFAGSIKDIHNFQGKVIVPFLDNMLKSQIKDFTQDGLQETRPNQPGLYISNHRDIILDSGLMNYAFFRSGYPTTEIAIGSNLLQNPDVRRLARLNKSFVVNRDVSPKEMYFVSQRLSNYIHHQIEEEKQSVWIAQREGRAKDGNDFTQTGLLKMLLMGGAKDPKEAIRNMNIKPFAISYEFDPCDALKAQEHYNKSMNPDHQKGPLDDIISMQTGLVEYKGNVHIGFTEGLNKHLGALDDISNRNDYIFAVAKLIDTLIHYHYKLWPSNYICADLLNENDHYTDHYTQEDKDQFIAYIENKILKINGHVEAYMPYILRMYTNPLTNHLHAKKVLEQKG
ncbi:1-acyl-sn-glycerol-3-phosphate acyltransferase [Persicobacter sp. CCB-QB2]|uniref:1-acyl-sn-glycerol-3-phosphate acyltransferase n=1 Tax=Persicobacter sp. CCB-QB2 TaxID=1561025 RepID=UPI0006A9AABC|nr:1-acyl-sn-glycerol-3-phosphate acyltransferase [Persicobacter sp. CCB-QB2]